MKIFYLPGRHVTSMTTGNPWIFLVYVAESVIGLSVSSTTKLPIHINHIYFSHLSSAMSSSLIVVLLVCVVISMATAFQASSIKAKAIKTMSLR